MKVYYLLRMSYTMLGSHPSIGWLFYYVTNVYLRGVTAGAVFPERKRSHDGVAPESGQDVP
ncbi:hypothetical protein EHQ58_09105 [Leptospira ognonensis]|uniref:Uncharacterized protein n=1 Tax=Leptospira ognonensis TaxID=2484945 RepID=A0A4R9K2I2_9LEPT|nr:hypothetical protein EHQ58_09105 [Leptospira ognonensis]